MIIGPKAIFPKFAHHPMFWVLTGSLGSAGLTILSFRVIGEIAGATALGLAVLLHGVVLLLTGLTAGPVSQAIGRYYFDTETDEDRGRLWSTGLSLAACGFFLGGVLLLGLKFSGWISAWGVLAALSLTLAAEMVRPLCAAWLQAGVRFAPVALSQLIDVGLRPVVASLALDAGVEPLSSVLLAYAVAALVSGSLLLACIVPGVPFVMPQASEIRRIKRYGLPLVGNGLFGWLAGAGDRYLIAAAIDPRATGIYVAASALGGRISLTLGTILETYYRPQLYTSIADSDRLSLRNVCGAWLRSLALVGSILFVGLLMSMPLIEQWLLPAEFRLGASPVIAISFLALWVVAFGFIPQRINYAFERTGRVLVAELGGGLVMTGAVYLLARQFGLPGAALGLLVSGMSRLLISLVMMRRTLSDLQQ